MELVGLALGGFAMIAVVFSFGVLVQILFDRRFGVGHVQRTRADEQLSHHAARSQLGGFGPGGSPR